MNAIIPDKRKDGKSSFEDLVSYVSVRDDIPESDLQEALERADIKPETSHRNRFHRLVDYATRLRNESFVALVDVMEDGCEWVDFYGVTCFHNCVSIETASQEMEYTARQARFGKSNSDPVFHYILSWQAHESPRPEQLYGSVRHTLKALGLSSHQYVSAVHTDTDNLHVHVAVNRVHPETGYINDLSFSKEKLSRACRELELKYGFSPDNGCWVHAPGNRIVRRTSAERDRLNAWRRGKKQTLKEYIADTAIAGLREKPVSDWLSLHRRLAEDGLYLMVHDGELMVMDGWERSRAGIVLSAFGPSWSGQKLAQKFGDYQPVPQDIFSQVGTPGRYDPDAEVVAERPVRVSETESLHQYACRHFSQRLPELARAGHLRSSLAVHHVLAEAGLWLTKQHGHLVICDGYDHNQTPVRADSVWSLLTLSNLERLKGGWQPVPADIFRHVTPSERFTGRSLGTRPLSDGQWKKLRAGAGPQGAIKREIFSDKESLWGYAASRCRQDTEMLIRSGQFTWKRCHELFARQGLMLKKQYHGLVVVDAYNHEQTPVKASNVHPDLTLTRAEPYAGVFERAPADIFERVKPVSRYNPELAVSDRDIPGMKRDPELRRERREARAAARADLRARYLAWREQWCKPDLRYGERLREIHQDCRLRKAHIRLQYQEPLLRKLHYHIAEVQRMQALIELKKSVREERLQLVAAGKWYPPSYRQWVEQQAARGDGAAVSQLRGWDYRERRRDNARTTTAQRCVVICEPGGTPVYHDLPGLHASLQKNGSVRFRDAQTGRHVCTDFGDHVVFSNSSEYASLKRNMVAVAPVLFSKAPEYGFAPQGNDDQFNSAFANMVAWRNVKLTDIPGEYHISRPDVDAMRQESEERFRTMDERERTVEQPAPAPSDEWKPPSPL
ncbi:relaxase/mobilization nuclease domain-containing protein [Salmonella enterica]|uniref:Relaxase/mobilization nuclease domain-containing protein n=2 Tax=Salmonella enterica TaxID=28901 RepID=A0A765ECF6_SALER|nr:relaxase NikB [Salmonella enterica subsp. enterica serovar Java]EBR9313561.1 relaxase NikB [Salmonella enterica subsp. enterica serovar Muenchen]EDQ3993750.1 relaxase/mobilization nuclease domain-containing protein [Salmonella enterica subsp. enterica]EDS8889867.1 relaxase/mobilization nuclease domain-containing protein [Salmonella enterica]EDX3512276.1 relaxase/mobilization nuclease domain-containing protein [Salmonella enterica subsp. enterica serovar Adelaide]EEE5035634.1 relaxase/mobili